MSGEPDQMGLKQSIVINSENDLSRGKIAAQASHASLEAYERAQSEIADKWRSKGGKKVILWSGDKKLNDLYEEARSNNLPAYIVKDAGYTEVEPGTVTALGIGPAEEEKIDRITGDLRLVD